VGITLKITPQITEGDYVKLDIYQEISAVKQESENIVISVGPTTTKRSTKTSVVVRDRQTVVIGGLMQERTEENVTKVPLLGDIPVLGYLFKFKSVTKKKTNLLVFITPHVIREAEGLAQIAEDRIESFPEIKQLHYVEGELFVKFKEEIPEEKAQTLISQQGASVKRFLKYIKVYQIRLREGQSVEEAIKEYSAMPEVQYAEPNFQIKLQDRREK
jgi:general secretion pathway protein D